MGDKLVQPPHSWRWIGEKDAFECDCGETVTREGLKRMMEIMAIEDKANKS